VGVEYLALDANSVYTWVPSSKGAIVDDAVQFVASFYIGRIIKSTYNVAGKIEIAHGVLYYAETKEVSSPTYEALVCIPKGGKLVYVSNSNNENYLHTGTTTCE